MQTQQVKLEEGVHPPPVSLFYSEEKPKLRQCRDSLKKGHGLQANQVSSGLSCDLPSIRGCIVGSGGAEGGCMGAPERPWESIVSAMELQKQFRECPRRDANMFWVGGGAAEAHVSVGISKRPVNL